MSQLSFTLLSGRPQETVSEICLDHQVLYSFFSTYTVLFIRTIPDTLLGLAITRFPFVFGLCSESLNLSGYYLYRVYRWCLYGNNLLKRLHIFSNLTPIYSLIYLLNIMWVNDLGQGWSNFIKFRKNLVDVHNQIYMFNKYSLIILNSCLVWQLYGLCIICIDWSILSFDCWWFKKLKLTLIIIIWVMSYTSWNENEYLNLCGSNFPL